MTHNNRNKTGKFTSEGMKGNQNAKKPITKEMAKKITWDELFHAAELLTQKPMKELRARKHSGDLDNESLLTYSIIKNAVSGKFKPVQFLVEMICGKANQQVETTFDTAPTFIIKEK